MSRTLKLLAVPALAAAFMFGGAAAAQASGGAHLEGHRQTAAKTSTQAHCTVAPKCRPAPLPKPPGGWPCAKTHDCAKHHHRPICKPPVVVHPRPPVVHHKPTHHKPTQPASHVAGHKHVTAAAALPRTGSVTELAPYVEGGLGLIGLGMLPFLTGPLREFSARARVR